MPAPRTTERRVARLVIALYIGVAGFCVYLVVRTVVDMIDGASLVLGLFATFLLLMAIAWAALRVQVNLARLRQDDPPRPAG